MAEEKNAYETWRLPMEAVFQAIEPKSFLERGMGTFSTPWLLSKPLDRLVSVDTDPEWFERCSSDDARHQAFLSNVPDAELAFLESHKRDEWDAALVDGHTMARVFCLNHLLRFEAAKVVVVHDFEERSLMYNWGYAQVPLGYDAIRYTHENPQTGIFVKTDLRISVVEALRGLIEAQPDLES